MRATMIVGVEASTWSNPRGYGRYTRGLLSALLDEPGRHEYILFVDRQTLEQTSWPLPEGVRPVVAETRVSPNRAASAAGHRSIADMWAMANCIRSTRMDAVFFPSVFTYAPVFNPAFKIIGFHDAIAETYPQLVFPGTIPRLFWNLKNRLALMQADAVLTVSDYARRTLSGAFNLSGRKVWVVGEAPDRVFRPIESDAHIRRACLEAGVDPRQPFLIALGGLNPHKNLPSLLQIIADLKAEGGLGRWRLLLVGPAEEDTFTPGAATIREEIRRSGLGDTVRLTGFLPDEDVAALLTAATGLVMPSYMEGFGLGAVEAAACGTPVLATRNSPLPDLLSGAGLFFDPHDLDEMRNTIRVFIADEELRTRLAAGTLAHARRLTWERTANEFTGHLDALEAERAA